MGERARTQGKTNNINKKWIFCHLLPFRLSLFRQMIEEGIIPNFKSPGSAHLADSTWKGSLLTCGVRCWITKGYDWDLTEIPSPTRRPSVASKQNLYMEEQQNRRSSVPSGSGVHVYGSGSVNKLAEGTKNLWVWTGCHLDMNICTYNARSLPSDDWLIELEAAISRIK